MKEGLWNGYIRTPETGFYFMVKPLLTILNRRFFAFIEIINKINFFYLPLYH